MTPVGSPTPSTWQGARAAAGEGLIALFCPSQARAFSTKALNLSQRAAACAVVVGCYSRPEGWGPGSSRCCRQLISHRMPVLGSRTWQLPVGAVVLLRVAASILRRQPKGRASRLPGDHRRTRVSREFCQLSFSTNQAEDRSKNPRRLSLGGTLMEFRDSEVGRGAPAFTSLMYTLLGANDTVLRLPSSFSLLPRQS